jgi:hypothetical protein
VSGKSVLALAALAIAALALAWFNLARPWSFTVENRTYDGRFFRLDVKLSYKGEPHPISFVVGCKVHGVKYADGSTTREVGLTPIFYGHRMKDGQAVVVRPPDACDGETSANGEVPPSFMPLIIVYDNADTLDFGKGYMSDDAYDGPLAELKFESATITASDRAAWEEFRKSGPKNIVTREQWWSKQPADVAAVQGLREVFPKIGASCHGATRYQVPDEIKPLLHASPSYKADGPWSPTGEEESDLLWEKIGKQKKLDFRDWPNDLGVSPKIGRGGWGDASIDYGVVRRDGNPGLAKKGSFRQHLPPPTYYPYASIMASRNWPSDPSQRAAKAETLKDTLRHNILVEDGKYRGFAYCWIEPGFELKLQGRLNSFPSFDAVDGQRVHTIPPLRQGGWVSTNLYYVFEGDRYLLSSGSAGSLSSFGGDI